MTAPELPTRTGNLMQSPGSDGWTIYEPESDSLHVLNDSAKAIWELCDGETHPTEMAAAIAELTGLDEVEAERDVRATLANLRSINLVS